MRIFSLNMHHHMEVDGFTKLERIASKIAELEADVVMLQEMGQYVLSDIKYENIRYDNNVLYLQKILMEKHGINYKFYPTIFKTSYEGVYEEGLAILSKQEMDVTSFPVSKNTVFDNWETRYVQEFTMYGISFFNLHIGSDTENEKFIDQLNNVLKRNDNKKILIGDFNMELTPKIVGFDYFDPFYEKYKNDVMTCNGGKIDYCIMNFTCENECEYLFVDDMVSDHVALFVDIHVDGL